MKSTIKETQMPAQYTARGNRSFTVISLDAKTDDDAFWCAGEIAAQWGESVTILKNGARIGCALMDRGF